MIIKGAVVLPLKPTIDTAWANSCQSATPVVTLQTGDRSTIGREAGRAVAADMTASTIRRFPGFS
ncbi:hypothetical protein CMK14_02485 [Candidatus Poribacteria bacterium]|nr:hypothetical protein [Candidatus Poribacteria bacterium]